MLKKRSSRSTENSGLYNYIASELNKLQRTPLGIFGTWYIVGYSFSSSVFLVSIVRLYDLRVS
jgi:hypothetical protein